MSHSRNTYIFSREGIEITLKARKAVLDEVISHLAPFLNESYEKEITSKWIITGGEGFECEIAEDSVSDIMSPTNEPEREYIIVPAQRRVHIARPVEDVWIAQHMLRVVRTLVRNHVKSRHLLVHSAMVRFKGYSFAILGERKAGKTTTMLNFTRLGADFISNDDLSFVVSSDHVMGFAWPRSIAIRNDVLDKIPFDFSRLISEKNSHPANKAGLQNSYHYCFPEELCDALNISLVVENKVDFLLFPNFGEKCDLQKLSSDEVYERLLQNTLSQTDGYSGAIDRLFEKGLSESQIKEKLYKVSRLIPGYSLEQCFDDLDLSIECLLNELY